MTYNTFPQPGSQKFKNKTDEEFSKGKKAVGSVFSGLTSLRSLLIFTAVVLFNALAVSVLYIISGEVSAVGSVISGVFAFVASIVTFVFSIIFGTIFLINGSKTNRLKVKLVGGFMVSMAFAPLVALIIWTPFIGSIIFGDMLLIVYAGLTILFTGLWFLKK